MTSQSAVREPWQAFESKAPCHLQCCAVELADIFAEMSKKGDHFALRSGRPERGYGALEASIHILEDSRPPASPSLRAEMTHKKGVAEQRNFLCEEGCLLTDHAAVATTRAYE